MIEKPGNGSDSESLEFTFKYNPPMDHVVAERILKEAKHIFDDAGIVFLLWSGACLGAVRDGAMIPWDDDVDILSVMGVNGLTEDRRTSVLNSLRNNGFFIKEIKGRYSTGYSMIKDYIRIGWDTDYIENNTVTAFPGVQIPAEYVLNPKEILYLGEKFLVPNPPEEYLRLKYGEEWKTPKRAGQYEIDVVKKIPDQVLTGDPAWIRVLDVDGQPVYGAEVSLAGGSRSATDESGTAEIILPGPEFYALTIPYRDHQQVLYMEDLQPHKTYIYRAITETENPDVGTLGNVLVLEN